jgi:hypothetical protein
MDGVVREADIEGAVEEELNYRRIEAGGHPIGRRRVRWNLERALLSEPASEDDNADDSVRHHRRDQVR